MRILVVGSGGREHALCWKLASSPLCDALYCAPGNAGIAKDAECVPIGAEDIPALVAFAKEKAIDFVVVGPEGPLSLGVVDRFEAEGLAILGPTRAAAHTSTERVDVVGQGHDRAGDLILLGLRRRRAQGEAEHQGEEVTDFHDACRIEEPRRGFQCPCGPRNGRKETEGQTCLPRRRGKMPRPRRNHFSSRILRFRYQQSSLW